ncbi:MAG TPA: hypothetical protein VJA21_01050 [Verrucomicrobiae bacterium]
MKITSLLVAVIWLGGLAAAAPALGQHIWLNVSVKAILDPATGQPASYATTNLAPDGVAYANELLARNHRGYRLRLVEYFWIGGSSHPHDPSTWYPFQYNTNTHQFLEEEFRADAYTNYPSLYGWNHSALNVFLTTFVPGTGAGAFCANCSSGRPSDFIANGRTPGPEHGLTTEQWFGAYILHEIGHFFSLTHTFGGTKCYTDALGDCVTPPPGNDEFSDTLGDVQNVSGCNCWTVENLAWTNFNRGYSALDATQKVQVDNVWFNLMSYHESWEARLTEQQLDHWADTGNTSRLNQLSGVTLFVSTAGNDANSGLLSASPKRQVQAALNSANPSGGDIVLLRPGNYNERITFTRPGTLRATSAGWATLGRQ